MTGPRWPGCAVAIVLAGYSGVNLDEPAPVGRARRPVSPATRQRGMPGSGSGAAQSQVTSVDLAASRRCRRRKFCQGGLLRLRQLRRQGRIPRWSMPTPRRFHQRPTAEEADARGATDERGGREYNPRLGQKRAEAVQKVIVLLGGSDEPDRGGQLRQRSASGARQRRGGDGPRIAASS